MKSFNFGFWWTAALAALLVACTQPDPTRSIAVGKAHLAKGNLPAAVIELKNALQISPNRGDVRLILGKALLDLDDSVSAAVELNKAFELGVDHDEVLPLLARARLRIGEPLKVLELEPLAKIAAKDARADFLASIAQAYASQKNMARAEAALAEALKSNPESAAALVLKARVAANRGDTTAAMDILDAVLRAAPRDGEAWRSKGSIALRMGDIRAALTHFGQAVEVNPGDVSARIAILDILLQQGDLKEAQVQFESLEKARPLHLQTQLYRARLAFARGEPLIAGEQADALVRKVPENRDVLFLSGSLALQRGDLAVAEQRFVELLNLFPSAVTPRQQLVQVYLRKGDAGRAQATLQPLLDAGDVGPDTLLLAGSTSLMAGDAGAAEDYLRRAAQARPTDVAGRTALALARLAQGDEDRGLAELGEVAGADQGASADLALVGALLTRGRTAEAMAAVARLEKKQPDRPLPTLLKGYVLRAKGDRPGAREAFEQVLKRDPRYQAAIEALVNLDVAEGKIDAARARLDAQVKPGKAGTAALLARARLEDGLNRPAAEVMAIYKRAIDVDPTDVLARQALIGFLAKRGDFTRALSVAQEAVAALPASPQLLGMLGAVQAMAGELHQASGSYAKLAVLQPTSVEALLALGEVQLRAGSVDAAEKSVQQAMRLAPRRPSVFKLAAQVDLRQGKPDQALARAKSLQKLDPKSPEGWQLEGDVASAASNWKQAQSAYRTALGKRPSTVLATRLHATLRLGGDGKAAETFASEWLRTRPKDAEFRFHVGSTLLFEKAYERAAEEFRAVLLLTPTSHSAYNNLAWLLATMKRPGAVDAARKAVEIAPDQPGYLDTLALALASEGRAKAAVVVQRQAVALAPKAVGLRIALARYLFESGDREAAAKELELVAAAGSAWSRHPDVVELRKRL